MELTVQLAFPTCSEYKLQFCYAAEARRPCFHCKKP